MSIKKSAEKMNNFYGTFMGYWDSGKFTLGNFDKETCLDVGVIKV